MYGHVPPSLMQLVTRPDLPVAHDLSRGTRRPAQVGAVDRLALLAGLAVDRLRNLRAGRPAPAQPARPCESQPC